jgi:pimeloyl-ACP methyl ester carboxylesterase
LPDEILQISNLRNPGRTGVKNIFLTVFVFLFSLLQPACRMATPGVFKERAIEPGEKIGEMTLEQGSLNLPYPSIWYFCDPMPDETEPTKSSADCQIPEISGLTIDMGWFARESKLDSNWKLISWAISVDGVWVNLEAFDWIESGYIAHGEDNKSRRWLFNLLDLSPGLHTLMIEQGMRQPVDDGYQVYQPGHYQHSVQFTVLEKDQHPHLSSNTRPGQNPYTSEQSGLDFLLYLPGDYGQEPLQEWPLIVYLHGAPLRGATLELLKQLEPLPKKLEREAAFPFIVLSPLGDGGYEFWSQDEMIKPLFALLAEIQSKLLIDSKRIYLTGNDMGGSGVWTIGLQNPEYFAALAPVAGYNRYPFVIPENICDLRDVPVRAYHGKRDPFVPAQVAQDLVEALKACGGDATLILSQDMRNDIPFKVYSDPLLYEWLLMHSLK